MEEEQEHGQQREIRGGRGLRELQQLKMLSSKRETESEDIEYPPARTYMGTVQGHTCVLLEGAEKQMPPHSATVITPARSDGGQRLLS